MNAPTKRPPTMSQAEELRQLREHIRTDVKELHQKFDVTIRLLHEKLDKFNEKNTSEHNELKKEMAKIDKTSEVNTAVMKTKIGLFVALISTLVASGVSWALGKI